MPQIQPAVRIDRLPEMPALSTRTLRRQLYIALQHAVGTPVTMLDMVTLIIGEYIYIEQGCLPTFAHRHLQKAAAQRDLLPKLIILFGPKMTVHHFVEAYLRIYEDILTHQAKSHP